MGPGVGGLGGLGAHVFEGVCCERILGSLVPQAPTQHALGPKRLVPGTSFRKPETAKLRLRPCAVAVEACGSKLLLAQRPSVAWFLKLGPDEIRFPRGLEL